MNIFNVFQWVIFQWVIPIRLIDLIEIVLFAFILYKLYLLMRGTIAVQIFLGIFFLIGVQSIVIWQDMTMLRALFGLLSEVFVLAFIVLFQPEIRRLLLAIGQNPIIRRFVAAPAQSQIVTEIVRAVELMSSQRIGGLIAVERTTGLRNYAETGASLMAKVTEDLIITIFHEKSPLHDGAIIIRNNRIEAARCILPVSTSMKLSPHLGLRHRSAIGLSELTDALVVVVSEETGKVSVAMGGELIIGISQQELREYLSDALAPDSQRTADLAPIAG